MTAVAALYIDPKGPYPRIICGSCKGNGRTVGCYGCDGSGRAVDCWDASRDARLYDGPHPVVAHPPCKHWVRLAHLAKVGCNACAWTGPLAWHNGHCDNGYGDEQCDGAVVSDRDCAPRAVEQVRRWGGVLEHPAGSRLWKGCELPIPDLEPAPGSRMALCGVRRISTVRNERGDFTDDHGGYTIEVDQVEWGHVARKRTWLYLVGVPREALEAPPFPGRVPTSQRGNDRTPPLFAEYLIRLARSSQK